MRRIVYSIGEGLLVIALFTAALSAQNATFAVPAEVTFVAPPSMQVEGLSTAFQNGKTSIAKDSSRDSIRSGGCPGRRGL